MTVFLVLLTGGKFAACVHDSVNQVSISVVYTSGASFVVNILANFGGKINRAQSISRGLEEDGS